MSKQTYNTKFNLGDRVYVRSFNMDNSKMETIAKPVVVTKISIEHSRAKIKITYSVAAPGYETMHDFHVFPEDTVFETLEDANAYSPKKDEDSYEGWR